MAETYGRRILDTFGRSIQLTADGKPEAKAGGVTIDWAATVTAVAGADVTWLDSFVVKIGEKGLRYGQVVCLITSVVGGSVIGNYGPYDPAATDGRQTLTRGSCFLLNESMHENMAASNHPPVIEGGLVFVSRVIQSGVGAASLAAGPTLANLLAAFPRLRLVND
jgi:hypothetical protein